MALQIIPKEAENGQRNDANKLNKNKIKKLKKKAKKLIKKQNFINETIGLDKRNQIKTIPVSQIQNEEVKIEYVPEDIKFNRYDPYYEFNKIFEKFKIEVEEPKTESAITTPGLIVADPIKNDPIPIKARGILTSGDEDDDEENRNDSQNDADGKPKLSKKKMKKMNRLSVAELKQLVNRPDIVEMHDVTSRDPKLLVSLKSTRNSVPVPRHWCFKRKYLQGKRGIEKPAFDLPDFIQATGIMEMRQALAEKEEQKTLKSKMRERVRPKMGKIDIDYQKLHDAFFKWQTKPRMTNHGDLYYEGKEFEIQLKEKKPGNLSDELRTALGMPIGHSSDKYPPPWLIAMQRYGPPPSYPALKIPGLNAPIPEGTSFGYHAGGWGKPPVDELGRPLYGDVFGTLIGGGDRIIEAKREDENIDKTRWGELESDSEEESEDDGEGVEEPDATGLITPGDAGLITPSGSASIPVGIETPESIELRKRRIEDQMDQGSDTPANLYAVLPERKVGLATGQVMGSTHVYDIAAAAKKNVEGVEVTLNPEELDLDVAAMKAKYEQTLREQQNQIEKEDLSDMVAEHQARQQKKRKKQQQTEQSTKNKKMKEFKF